MATCSSYRWCFLPFMHILYWILFMHLVFQVENRYHSAGRARRFFHSVIRDNNSVVPHLFAIVAEQQRKQLVDAAQR